LIRAGVKEVKNNLSQLLAKVKAGEEVVITDRGRPIARIVKENREDKSIRAALGPLIQNGLIALPNRSTLKDRRAPLKVSGKPVSEMVLKDRR
jgi:antitoxin (DNA-binding transcriptional repressor) of toxin-antitoxin stability system